MMPILKSTILVQRITTILIYEIFLCKLPCTAITMLTAIRIFILLSVPISILCQSFQSSCTILDLFINVSKSVPNNSIYIFYDVNPAEGFNLRRDVYIRMAVFIKNLRKKRKFNNTKLVLPPFNRLYHWKSNNIVQENLLWKNFFNLKDLKKFTAVLDYDDFIKETKSSNTIYIDEVFHIKHFDETFTNGVFIDKFEFSECSKPYYNPIFKGKKITCLRFQGSTDLLEKVLEISSEKIRTEPKLFYFINAEIVLHNQWGNKEYWQARRSMRFSDLLINIAHNFRIHFLNSTNKNDLIQRPDNWKDERIYRGARGGPYLCAHLRRGDFTHGREKTIPTLKSAAQQINEKTQTLNIDKVFISSDCNKFEYKNLKSYISKQVQVFRFVPESIEMKDEIKDGGIAIVDQIICSYARFFIGTYESTFTYRIYEEREILGFRKENTFNTFCKKADFSDCLKNPIWPIVY